MKLELVRVNQGKFKYYLKIDGNYVTDPRFIYDHPQAGKEKFDHIKEVIAKFGDIDYQVGELNDVIEEVVLNSIEVNKGDKFYVTTKISGSLTIKK
jgi:hypothetical protein